MELHRKGVSPIIATVILVLIAVAAGVMLWLWVSGFASTTPTEQQALNERIRIDAVKIENNTGNNIVIIYVRNIGNVNVTISAAYILDISNIIVASNTDTSQMPTVSRGAVGEVKVDVSSEPLNPGYVYKVRVVTTNGVEATYTFVAP